MWPFDWSCSELFLVGVVFWAWMAWAAASAAKKAAKTTADAAKKVLNDDTTKEVGLSLLKAWFRGKYGR